MIEIHVKKSTAVALGHLLILLMLFFLIRSAKSNPRSDIIGRTCMKGHVSNLQKYIQTFHTVTSEMAAEMRKNKFAYGVGGDPNEQMYVFSQCMSDLSAEDCALCFSELRSLLPGCFPTPGGRFYLDGCFIRVDNVNFDRQSQILDKFLICGKNKLENMESRDAVHEVLAGLRTNAPNNNGYASLQGGVGNPPVYGLANCWKLLNTSNCASCLEKAVESAMTCLPGTEGRLANSGCFLHYSDYQFVNDVDGQATRDLILEYATLIFGAVAVCLIAVGTGFCLGNTAYRQLQIQPQKQATDLDVGPSLQERSMHFLQFKYSTLQLATQNFSDANKIGHGGYGEVFKGTLKDGREFAIKHLYMSGKSRSEDVYTEMDIISRAEHTNLVRFLGCCFTDSESFIVYEYLANRSLDLILFDPVKKKELDWKRRMGIINGTARGLHYLHSECQVRIVHRDIKASNILLDARYRAKIADFGLARFSSCDKSLMTTAIAGTLGYMAPEYLAQGRLTEKVDVYSFGVVVLEIVSGEQNNKFQAEDSMETLVTYTWRQFITKTSSVVIDSNLELGEEEEEMKRTIHIALLCTQEAPSQRPTMETILQMLRQRNIQLPYPSKPPFMMDSVASMADISNWHDRQSNSSLSFSH